MLFLIDLETAKRDLRIEDDASDDDVVEKIGQASEIVQDYLKRDLSEFDVGTSGPSPHVPGPIKAATLLVLRALYDGGEPLSETVKNLLHRQRDPAMA